jgi:uncharacterized protein YbaR (Trm112 family)
MKERLTEYLACPSCQASLVVSEIKEKDGIEIMEGRLSCSGCGRNFPIVRGVPRFADHADLEAGKAATAFSFGWQWTHFTQDDQRYERQFLGWLNPVRPEFFKDKVVLDAGCGKGRHTLLAAAWGAREVISIDPQRCRGHCLYGDPTSRQCARGAGRHLSPAVCKSV